MKKLFQRSFSQGNSDGSPKSSRKRTQTAAATILKEADEGSAQEKFRERSSTAPILAIGSCVKGEAAKPASKHKAGSKEEPRPKAPPAERPSERRNEPTATAVPVEESPAPFDPSKVNLIVAIPHHTSPSALSDLIGVADEIEGGPSHDGWGMEFE
eukprot:Colp12_sorted_trinity150504_noHs@4461